MLKGPNTLVYTGTDLVDETLLLINRPPMTEEFTDQLSAALVQAVESDYPAESVHMLLWRLPAFDVLSKKNQMQYIKSFQRAIELGKSELVKQFIRRDTDLELNPSAPQILEGLITAIAKNNVDNIEALAAALSTEPQLQNYALDRFVTLLMVLCNNGYIDAVESIYEKHGALINSKLMELVEYLIQKRLTKPVQYFLEKDINLSFLEPNRLVGPLCAWLMELNQDFRSAIVNKMLAIIAYNAAQRLSHENVTKLLQALSYSNCTKEMLHLLNTHAKNITVAQIETALMHALKNEHQEMVSILVTYLQTHERVWNKMPWSPNILMFEEAINNPKPDLLDCLLQSKHNDVFLCIVKKALEYAADKKNLKAISAIFKKVPELSFDDKNTLVENAAEDFKNAVKEIIEAEKAMERNQKLLDEQMRTVRQEADLNKFTAQNSGAVNTEICLKALTEEVGNLKLDQYKLKVGVGSNLDMPVQKEESSTARKMKIG